jgi:GxxExxY protein
MINKKYKHSDITGKVIGAAMRVHSTLGNGFQEVVYQRALALEFGERNLKFAREKEMPIFYRNKSVGTRRVDFLVEKCVLVELKALTKLEDVHLAQGINYLEAFKLEVGLIINFGAKKLEFKRVVNTVRTAD